MSVYTNLENKDVKEILKKFDIGKLMSFNGISDGITNTNYFLDTTKGKYVITIFEDIKKSKVVKYLKLMNFFSSNGLCSPEIMITKTDDFLIEVKNKPCSVMQKLKGRTVNETDADLCASLGYIIAKFHIAGESYKVNIANSRDTRWVKKNIKNVSKYINPEQIKLLNRSSKIFERLFNAGLPEGVIHSDLFRDNVLANKNKITGIIDYYYSFTGPFIYELAVIINDWCVNKNGTVNKRKLKSFMDSYNSVRKLSSKEREQINNAMIAAALRFYLSRLADMIFPKVGEITHIKDPSVFENILIKRFNQK